MRVRPAAQCASLWPDVTARDRRDGARFADAIEHIRWRLGSVAKIAADRDCLEGAGDQPAMWNSPAMKVL
jgi:hypothetical protein